jgi:hypothetical protein
LVAICIPIASTAFVPSRDIRPFSRDCCFPNSNQPI